MDYINKIFHFNIEVYAVPLKLSNWYNILLI